MILASGLLAGAAAPSPVQPPELLEPDAACVAPAVPSLYLGGPLGPCPEPPRHGEYRVIPLAPQSFMDE